MNQSAASFDTYYEISANRANGCLRVIAFQRDEKMDDESFANHFFTVVSKAISFSDCTDEDVLRIVFMGRVVEYAGWAPGMRYAYHYADSRLAWEGCFPDWDH